MRRAYGVYVGVFVSWAVLAAGARRAQAEETDRHVFGLGYKIGNGLGFLGADAVIRATPHLTFDLQANYWASKVDTRTATGFGFAPSVQGELAAIGHTPYLGVGFLYARLKLDNVTASGSGFFVNLGYQWRFASGVGVLVGAGLNYLGNVQATDGFTTIERPGGFHPNIEAGVRYFF